MNYKFIFALLIIFCSDLNAAQKDDSNLKQSLIKLEAAQILLSLRNVPKVTEKRSISFPCNSWLKQLGLANSLKRLFFSNNHNK